MAGNSNPPSETVNKPKLILALISNPNNLNQVYQCKWCSFMLKNKLVKFELDQSNDTEVYLLSLSPFPSQASQNFVTFSPFNFFSPFSWMPLFGNIYKFGPFLNTRFSGCNVDHFKGEVLQVALFCAKSASFLFSTLMQKAVISALIRRVLLTSLLERLNCKLVWARNGTTVQPFFSRSLILKLTFESCNSKLSSSEHRKSFAGHD